MSLINKEDLMQTLGITDMDCEKCGWYSRAARMCKRGSDFEDVCCAIENAPEVLPEPKWIPCSERLPEDDTLMLVNYIDRRPYAMDVWIGWHEMENVWYIDGEAHSREFGNEVIAWMPLPEPYREDGVE